MTAYVGNGGKALRVQAGGVCWVATGIAVELKEVGELDRDASAAAGAVIGAIASAAAGSVAVDGVVAVAAGVGVGDDLADFVEDGGGVATTGGCRGVDDVSQVGGCRGDLPVGSGVLVGSGGVVRFFEAKIPAIHAGDLVAGVCAPARAPEDGLGGGGGHDLAAVVGHIGASANSGLRRWRLVNSRKRFKSPRPMDAEHRRTAHIRQDLRMTGSWLGHGFLNCRLCLTESEHRDGCDC